MTAFLPGFVIAVFAVFAFGLFSGFLIGSGRRSTYLCRLAIDLGIALRRRYHLIPRTATDTAHEVDGVYEEIKRLI